MKKLTDLGEKEFNTFVYKSSVYCNEEVKNDLQDKVCLNNDIGEVREQVFSIFIDRLLSVKDMKRTDRLSKMIKDLSNDCWGYLKCYYNNINDFAKILNDSQTVDELTDIFIYYSDIVHQKTVEMREDCICFNEDNEYNEIFNLMYDILILLETMKFCKKPYNEVNTIIEDFLKRFDFEMKYNLTINKPCFRGNGTWTVVTGDRVRKLTDLIIYDSVYPCVTPFMVKEFDIKSIDDLLSVLRNR